MFILWVLPHHTLKMTTLTTMCMMCMLQWGSDIVYKQTMTVRGADNKNKYSLHVLRHDLTALVIADEISIWPKWRWYCAGFIGGSIQRAMVVVSYLFSRITDVPNIPETSQRKTKNKMKYRERAGFWRCRHHHTLLVYESLHCVFFFFF